MKQIRASFEIVDFPSDILPIIERVARTCYKSEDKISPGSAEKIVKMLLDKEHEAMLEFKHITVKLIVDRGVTHEQVRHRLASYAQESTRYANYSKEKFGREITCITPVFWMDKAEFLKVWIDAMIAAEGFYMKLLDMGARPEEARSVLPQSLKAELNVCANLREWKHIFRLRTSKRAHPQMREVMIPLLEYFHSLVPLIFDKEYNQVKN